MHETGLQHLAANEKFLKNGVSQNLRVMTMKNNQKSLECRISKKNLKRESYSAKTNG